MTIKMVPDGPDVLFPDNVVFVRPITDDERAECVEGNPARAYIFIDDDGDRIGYVAGSHTRAFRVATAHDKVPVWMH